MKSPYENDPRLDETEQWALKNHRNTVYAAAIELRLAIDDFRIALIKEFLTLKTRIFGRRKR